eukprot:4340410-Pyramimonas_sp.AAC.1
MAREPALGLVVVGPLEDRPEGDLRQLAAVAAARDDGPLRADEGAGPAVRAQVPGGQVGLHLQRRDNRRPDGGVEEERVTCRLVELLDVHGDRGEGRAERRCRLVEEGPGQRGPGRAGDLDGGVPELRQLLGPLVRNGGPYLGPCLGDRGGRARDPFPASGLGGHRSDSGA